MFSVKVKATVCDIRGRVLFRKALNVIDGNVQLWSNSQIGNGNYIISLECDRKKITRKFLLTR
jgi:hypothetical protein